MRIRLLDILRVKQLLTKNSHPNTHKLLNGFRLGRKMQNI
jgi:hypothetical protein